jgi:signal transduction histidine kinase
VATAWWGAKQQGPALIDPTLKGIALLFRVLGLVWMALLVIYGVTARPETQGHIGRPDIALTALAAAILWTGVTFWAASSDRWIRSPTFAIVDWVVAALVGVASPFAATGELFHGGFPMSWTVVAAYSGGLRWALPGSIGLGLEQFVVRLVGMERGVSGSMFAIVFPFIAFVAGWGFDKLREHSILRSEAERRLAEVLSEQARLEERAELANRLHDSVLQTLHAIRVEAGEPDQVRYLARRQERELKRTIEQFLSSHKESFRVALLEVRDEVEDMHGVAIDAVVKDDLALDPTLGAAIEAAREAMLNAARHSGADGIDVYAESAAGAVTVIVRDRGDGFDLAEGLRRGHGLANSILGRVEAVGGTVEINSSPGDGTEVTIRVPASH